MKFKIMVMSLGCFFILATSFCAHQRKLRGVSSTEVNEMFKDVDPLERVNSKGHKLFVYEKMHNERSATILVEYQCHGQEPLLWESFKLERFLGVSEVLEDTMIRLRYTPLSLLDFSNKSKKPTKEEINSTLPLDKVYDLSLACGKK